MSRKLLVMKAETALERKLTPDERSFLRVATRLFKPKPAHKTIPKKAEIKAVQLGAREIHIVRDGAGHATFAVCNCCRQKFFVEDTAIYGQVEDVFRRKFLQHECAPRQFGSSRIDRRRHPHTSISTVCTARLRTRTRG